VGALYKMKRNGAVATAWLSNPSVYTQHPRAASLVIKLIRNCILLLIRNE
jgi:hypothetical protein